jgi:2,5-diketo-D-gluconate reductase B
MQIPTCRLRSGFELPVLGLGTWRLADEQCTRVVSEAIEMGYRHIDTADIYDNHIAVGKALRQFDRPSLFVTSKVPYQKLAHDDLIATCERNLEELQLDYLDMYLLHWPNPDIPMEETFGALKVLHDAGRVRSIGVSNFIIKRLTAAMEISELPICTNQVEFHPLLYQQELLDFCRSSDVVVTAYAPLARTQALRHPVIKAIANEVGKTPAQVCLRWLVEKGIVAIPKASSGERLRENMGIFDWRLPAEAEQRIDDIPEQKRLITMEYAEF